MDWKLELVVVPVSDVDRAKTFYTEKVGFNLHVDHRAGDDFRVVQLTPPGSACSIAIMTGSAAPGSVRGLHLIVSDIDAARAELVERGTEASAIFHFESGTQVPGPDPRRGDYGSFLSFSDPDGNTWLVQEVRRSGPGGMTGTIANATDSCLGEDELPTALQRDSRDPHRHRHRQRHGRLHAHELRHAQVHGVNERAGPDPHSAGTAERGPVTPSPGTRIG